MTKEKQDGAKNRKYEIPKQTQSRQIGQIVDRFKPESMMYMASFTIDRGQFGLSHLIEPLIAEAGIAATIDKTRSEIKVSMGSSSFEKFKVFAQVKQAALLEAARTEGTTRGG